MDTPVWFFLAVGACAAALLILVLVVLKPRSSSIPLERRRFGFTPDESALGRVSQSAVQVVDSALGRSGGPFNRDVLYNAGVKQSPADFTVLVAIATVLLGILGILLANPMIGILVAVATPFAAKVVLVFRTEKRRSKFEGQLTDTIQMLIGGLRVGHSIMRSLEAAAQESQEPTSEELARIVNEVRIGKDARQAIEDCAIRMDSEDFRWIGQAIQINREVGGDLAEVLEQVAGTIRERSEIKGHVRSLSAEGRMSAVILMALPVGVGMVLGIINPGYLRVFISHPVGIALTVLSLVLFIVGGFWMNRTVKIKF
ncbi:type II secretion system F family protein [Arthrobacter sp. AK01]|uniref:type II secretion system F family protein n=1 Tax=Micrococcaceae TaxID=1268 RepID=UPI001E4E6BF9|nr:MULTISPECIES: type II secretion system F family protein [Micrococcaceae]MCD4850336.1 type II secretion system F family protein [Arthrobacter sp. AK01]MCP1414938.1 tight adherence protein B [Paenarthrobacter sp. A20]